MHKKYVDHPFKAAGIDGYKSHKSWNISNINTNLALTQQSEYDFPSLAELDAEYYEETSELNPDTNTQVLKEGTSINNNSWPDHPRHPNPVFHTYPILLGMSKSLSKLITEVIKSDDKLFFISNLSDTRREWNLVQVDFEKNNGTEPKRFYRRQVPCQILNRTF